MDLLKEATFPTRKEWSGARAGDRWTQASSSVPSACQPLPPPPAHSGPGTVREASEPLASQPPLGAITCPDTPLCPLLLDCTHAPDPRRPEHLVQPCARSRWPAVLPTR